MTKMIVSWAVLVGLAGAAFAQPADGSAAGGSPAAGFPAPAAVESSAHPPAEAHPALAPVEARKLCAAAMNADKAFAQEIAKIADERAAKQRDDDTVAAHNDAYAHIQKNERHVIYAYAAMWIAAALFVIFLWRRQQVLKAEIANLRRDLEAAAEAHSPAEQRS